MNTDDISAKERIFKAACELIADDKKIKNITVRLIAEKAGVNLALINYYYQSKDNLLYQAVQQRMAEIIGQVFMSNNSGEDAAAKLKGLLAITADFAFKYHDVWKIAALTDIKQGCKNSCEMVMPLLKEIYRDKNDSDLRITALQLILPFYNIVLYTEAYNDYLKTNFYDPKQRALKINRMTDSLIKNENKNPQGIS